MSEKELNNGERLKALLQPLDARTEFGVPDDFFEVQSKEILLRTQLADKPANSEFTTPPDYFEDAANRLWASIETDHSKDEQFFENQQSEILAMIRLEAFNLNTTPEFDVPPGYFAAAQNEILHATVGNPVNSRVIPFYQTGHARMWMGIAAAACIAFITVMIWPQEQGGNNQPSFSELLEKTDLDENDLEFFATEEEYDQLLLSEIELLTDTVITDSVKVVVPEKPKPAKGTTTGKDKKDSKEIKPKDTKKAPSFDELTEEEILEFLLEEGDDDLLDDL